MSNEEIWKDIEGYEGYYQVSNKGRVMSLSREVVCNNSTRVIKERILNQVINKKLGYKYVMLSKDNKQKNHRVHRLVAQAFIPNPESNPQVNHIDYDKTNNNASNLEWVSQSENMLHSYLNEQSPKGEKSHYSKLSQEDIKCIRNQYNIEKYTLDDLSIRYKCSKSNISLIVNNVTWKHI
jgi:hypothetical protein